MVTSFTPSSQLTIVGHDKKHGIQVSAFTTNDVVFTTVRYYEASVKQKPESHE